MNDHFTTGDGVCFRESFHEINLFFDRGNRSVCAQARDVMKSDNMTSVNFMGKCLS